ncbi:MAG: secretion protein [Limnobacter sp.]|uniref:secretion protein n=1 Tax=Limnobacter sp. TaxID=2003368 RepID=UPI0032F08BA4
MSRFIPNARLGKLAAAVALALCIAHPAAAEQNAARSFVDMVKEVPLVPVNMRDSEMLAKVTEAVKYIKRLELPQAHFAVNEALQLDPRNSHLHFLNGFVYHLQARQGDTQKGEMAQEGYEQALRIDPSNWIAQEFLGLAHMDLKQFDKAKRAFSEVLLLTPDSAVSAYGLMVASYVTGDAKTACAMADQFRKVSEISSHGFIRSSIAVYASCGNFTQAEYMRDILNSFYQGGPEVQRADRRVAQWKSFYSNQPVSLKQQPEQLAQAFDLPAVPYPKPSKPAPEPDAAVESVPVAQAPAPAVADAASGPRMLLIDVVLLSTQELISTSKGVNLLNALTLQLGNVAGNVAAYSRVNNSTVTNGGAADVSTAITRAVTIPALSYSLNIANANSSLNEVLARPTLAAIEGLPSEFFSGTNLSAGFVSTSVQGGTTVVPLEKRIGIKLAVTPVFLPQGRIQLKVEAQRTNLNATTENPRVAYQIEIGETTANANVVMNLGDTLVLSGLSEKSSASNRDGVPGLQDVPGLQYLFSNKRTNDLQRSVLILVTPRSPVQISNDANRESDSMDNRMKMLREKFGFSNTMPGNIEAVMTQLDSNDFFREFRQGDVTMERWERMRTTGDRLREALEFLYY